jgi:V/A-type H+-transporting ATPase subunit C
VGAVARNAFLHARVSTLSGRLLGDAALEWLVDAEPDRLQEILREAGISGYDPGRVDALGLERLLYPHLFADAQALSTAMSQSGRALLLFWIRRFELANLKAIIRGKFSALPVATISEQLLDVGSFATLDAETLLRTDDVAELLRMLEATPYGDIARRARVAFEEQRDLFTLDASIDRRYLIGLQQLVDELPTEERPLVRRLAGALADHLNLVWLLRFRFAHGLAPAEAYYFLSPGGSVLGGTQLQALAQLGSQTEVLGSLPPPLDRELAPARSVTDVDQIMEGRTCRVAAFILARTTFNWARAYAYLYLRERQLRQIHTALKGRWLQLPPDLVRYGIGLSLDSGIAFVTAAPGGPQRAA